MCHSRCAHGGSRLTLNELRTSGYRVICGNATVKTKIFHCMQCCRLQGRLVPANIRLDEDVWKKSFVFVFKTSWSRSIYVHLGHISSRHIQDVFETSSRRLQNVSKTYHQVKLFLLTRLREVFNTFLRRSFSKTII